MDDIDTTVETAQEPSVAKACATAFIVSAAATAGTFAGFYVVSLAVTGTERLRARRAAKKATSTEE